MHLAVGSSLDRPGARDRGGRGARGRCSRGTRRAGSCGSGLFELPVAVQLALAPRPDAHRDLPGTGGMGLVGTGIGALSTLLGIGGGTLTAPLLVFATCPSHQAVGTSAACGLPIALPGRSGSSEPAGGRFGLPAGSSGYPYWPAVAAGSAFLAPLGARLAHALPVATLRRGSWR